MNDTKKTDIEQLADIYLACLEFGTVKIWEEKELLLLMDHFAAERQFDRSLDICEDGLLSYPYSLAFYLKKILYLLEMGRFREVPALLDHVQVLSPKNQTIVLLRARMLFKLNKNAEALALLEGMEGKFDPAGTSESLVLQASILEEEGKLELLFPLLSQAVWADSKNEEAMEFLWSCVESGKKYQESLPVFSRVLDMDPYNGLAWYYLGLSHSYLGFYEEALEALEFAFLSTPKLEIAYREYANLCFELRKFREARDVYEEMIALFVSDPEVLLACGLSWLELEDETKALSYFRKALRSDPMNDEVLYHIGEIHLRHAEWKKAGQYYRRAIAIEDQREEYHASLGIAYQRLGEETKAESCFQEALNLAPSESKYWLFYLSFLIQADRKQEAIDLARAGESETEGSVLVFAMVACLLAAGRRQEALLALGNALEEDYPTHTILFSLLPDTEVDPDISEMLAYYRPEAS